MLSSGDHYRSDPVQVQSQLGFLLAEQKCHHAAAYLYLQIAAPLQMSGSDKKERGKNERNSMNNPAEMRQNTHRGAQTHSHKVKGLALCRLS